MSEQKETKIDLGQRVVGEIELPKLDLTPYIGKKVKIEKVEEFTGIHGFYIKVFAESVDTIKRETKEDIVLQPSRMFGLQEDEEGNLGWGKDTKLGQYLKKHKVKHYNDLVGKSVIVQIRDGKNNSQFLDFN